MFCETCRGPAANISSAKGSNAEELITDQEEFHMPEYECAVAKVHRRLYGQPQSSPPVCCGKPMVLKPGAPELAAPAQPATAASNPQALCTREVSAVPQPEKNWWQLWK